MVARWLLPFSGRQSPAQGAQDTGPFLAFRRDMDRVFDDFVSSFGFPGWLTPSFGGHAARYLTPQTDMNETDEEIRVATELPGIDEKDIDITLADDLLTIHAQKQDVGGTEDQDYVLRERSRGTFIRSIRLPFTPDPDQVRAECRNGVLSVTLPKPKEARAKVRRIDVRHEAGAARAERLEADRAAAGDKPSVQIAQSTAQQVPAPQSPGE